MNDRRLRLRLGLFVGVSALALAILAVLFGGSPRFFTTQSKYVVTFAEAPGMTKGTPVRKSGVRVGEVVAIDLDDSTGLVRLTVAIEPKFQPRTGEEPVISRGILSGDTALDFVPKLDKEGNPVPRGEAYPPGSEIAGVSPLSTRTLLTQASGAIPTAQDSLIQITKSAARFEQSAPKVDKAADEIAALARSAREVIPELRQTNNRVQELLGSTDPNGQPVSVRDMLREIIDILRAVKPLAEDLRQLVKVAGPEFTKALVSVRQTSDSANDLLNPENRKAAAATLKNTQAASDDLVKTIRLTALVLDQADRTIKEFNARLVQSEKLLANLSKAAEPAAANSAQIVKDASETMKNLSVATQQLAATIAEVRETVKLVNKPDGSFQKVLTDPGLYNNLNDATVNLTRVLMRAEKIAKDLEVFADKVARRPETIGIGGVVRPSTGLKEAPNSPLPTFPAAPLPPDHGPRVTPIPPVPFGTSFPVPSYKPVPPSSSDLPPLPEKK